MDQHRSSLTRRQSWLLAALPGLFIVYFFAYPVVAILGMGLVGDGRSWAEVATRSGLADVAWFTTWQAVASTLLTVLLGMPVAWVLARFSFPGRAAIRAGLMIPFVMPTVVVGAAFLALAGPTSRIDLSGSVWLILSAHVFYNLAVVIRVVGGLWTSLDPRLEDAARMLGASRFRTFRAVTLPLLRPAIAAASSIVFLFSFTSFGVVLLLGGLRFRTIEVAIWQRVQTALDLRGAALLAIVQLLGVTAILFAYARYQARRSTQQHLVADGARPPAGPGQWSIVIGILTAVVLAEGAPLAVLAIRSLRTTSGWGFQFYRSLGELDSAFFVPATEAIRNSLWFGVLATTIALVVGGLAAIVIGRSDRGIATWFDAVLMLPLGTSAVTIGFGFLVALDWPVDLRTSVALVPIAHALVATPFVVRSVVPVLRSIRERLREAAATLGASPLQVLRHIDLPIISRALLAGAGLAFAVSLGEFGATTFIARPDFPTLPIAIFRYLGRPGAATFGSAMAMSTILMAVTAVVIGTIDRFRQAGGDL
ncbi:MAG: iron ABC transporter permease [Acidimicrobiia bacterium]|nr:iron ABC transporter permease [Acidimicrobiia bacterium]